MKAKILAIAGVVGFGVLAQANADEIQFVALPEVVRTTVVRESNIPDYSRVTWVIRDNQGIYEVTVRRATDNEVLFVDPAGRLARQQTVAVAAPVQTTRPIVTETVTEGPSTPGVNTFVRSLTMTDISSLKRRATKKSTATEKPVQNGSLRFTRKATSPKSITSHCNNQKGRCRPAFLFFAFLEEQVWQTFAGVILG